MTDHISTIKSFVIWISILFFFIFTTCDQILAQQREKNEILIGVDRNNPPYEFINNKGQLDGFNIDLMKAVSRLMGIQPRFVSGSWPEIRSALEKNRIDAVSGMHFSKRREQLFDFSMPHTIVYHAMFVRTDSKVTHMEELKGKTVIVINGGIMQEYVNALDITNDMLAVNDTSDALRLLSAGRFDCALVAKLQGQYLIKTLDLTNIVPVGAAILPRDYCFAVAKGNMSLITRLDQGLNLLKNSGQYKTIREKWFGILERRDYRDYFRPLGWIMAFLLLMLTASWVWNHSLRKMVKSRTRELQEELNAHERTTRSLAKREEYLRTILESSSDAIATLDAERKILDCNLAFTRQFGFSRHEVTGRSMALIHPGEDSFQALGRLAYPVINEQGFWRGEYEYRNKDGRIVPMETTISLMRTPADTKPGYVAIMRDITERKRSEEERMRLAAAIDQATEWVAITDSRGKILFANPAFEKCTGFLRSEAMGTDLILSESPASGLNEAMMIGTPWQGRITSHRKDGTAYEEELSISPVRDTSGSIVNFVAVGRDVTLETQLEQQVRQAQKMDAIGALAGGIAHDFNNILSALIGYAEMAIHDDLEPDSPARVDVLQILRGCHRAKDLVEQILTFSRQSALERTPLMVGPIVKEILKLIRASLLPSITIEHDIRAQQCMIRANPTEIYQILLNLCTNAAQAMRNTGGRLEVRLDIPESENSEQAANGNSRHLRLVVIDTGEGMTPEIKERIFEPYFTTRDQSGGSGMGLAVVHGIVTSLEGEIRVDSSPRMGTTITVLLPLCDGEAAIGESDMELFPKGKASILLVDDEHDIVSVVRHTLSVLGYDVVATSRSSKAWEIFRASPDQFDLLMTDHLMPGLTGEELVARVREIRREIPVIMCSGFWNILNRTILEKLGIDVVLRKPVTRAQIAQTVHRVLEASR